MGGTINNIQIMSECIVSASGDFFEDRIYSMWANIKVADAALAFLFRHLLEYAPQWSLCSYPYFVARLYIEFKWKM